VGDKEAVLVSCSPLTPHPYANYGEKIDNNND
jgi:hypothetical protein